MADEFKWTPQAKNKLIACESHDEMKKAFPDKSIGNLVRRRAQFRAEKTTSKPSRTYAAKIAPPIATPTEGNLKILLIDIETSPNVADVWSLWNVNVGLNQLKEASRMICWAAKWVGSDEVEFRSEFHDGTDKMLARVHALMDESDVIVHYNGNAFDIKTINKEFLKEGILPPAPSKHIDLYRVIKSKFRFPSHKLAHISEALGIGNKVTHSGHSLWVNCLTGDVDAWDKMKEYNIQDTRLLEDLYIKLRPWITNHPNQNLYAEFEQENCTHCNSNNLVFTGSYAYTGSGKYKRYRCDNCGAYLRAGKREMGVSVQIEKF